MYLPSQSDDEDDDEQHPLQLSFSQLLETDISLSEYNLSFGSGSNFSFGSNGSNRNTPVPFLNLSNNLSSMLDTLTAHTDAYAADTEQLQQLLLGNLDDSFSKHLLDDPEMNMEI